MTELAHIAPAFVDMAHRIVWATVATVAGDGQPWTRILHPFWEWDGTELTGWIATGPTPVKAAHLEHDPRISATYWDPSQDTCTVHGIAEWCDGVEDRRRVWDLFAQGPEPVGYDPALIPGWDDAQSSSFVPLRITPTRLRVFPGTVLLAGEGDVLAWRR